MVMRKGLISRAGRTVVVTMIAALVLTMSELPSTAVAAHASAGVSAKAASGDATDFSSARRRRHYYRGGNAAGMAFMGFALGTIAGAIAAEQRREYYYDYGYYGPRYYYGGPYYGGPYYYGRRYYPLY